MLMLQYYAPCLIATYLQPCPDEATMSKNSAVAQAAAQVAERRLRPIYGKK